MLNDAVAGGSEAFRIVPAHQASWADLQAVFGFRGDAARCQCQWYKTPSSQWRGIPTEVRGQRFREQSEFDTPEAEATTGLVAYLEDQPVGWCAVEPRTVYAHLLTKRTPWLGREEDKSDPGVWAITCFVTRTGFRKRGVTYALAQAAVGFARDRGARALEGYSMLTQPGKEITWGELHVGSYQVFAAAGFSEVSRPSPRRVVMRIDF